ncbi:iron-sulfur cluster co-chaperone protein HscB [Lutzomyia longipalpis]|uniref:iron-sulfur cluster co-chaperone protein HscB n=1 Tax=Lutzomyia longipalpis TaxID=7200 RepID=UPI0024834513|nr:iron-sulfur cluster co-chaperone protein HscB [Lutzomyia longipalpis]
MSVLARTLIWESLSSVQRIPRNFFPHSNKFVRHFSSQNTCWNCGTTSGNGIFCSKCNFVQKVDEKKDYFEILDLPRNFNVDSNALTKKFREMQSILHPDKFSSRSQKEQDISLEWSSLVNKAYKTLLAPLKRGEYILEQNGVELPQDNSALDQKFLMEMMERNEEVDAAETPEDLKRLQETVKKELEELSAELSKAFDKKRLDEAVAVIVKMKYSISLGNSLKEKRRRLGFVD